MAGGLLASSYSTPGMRAYGAIKKLPDDFMWGDQDWGGYLVAEYVTTSFVDELRAPCFADASSRLTQNDPKMGLAFVEGFVYEEDKEDRVAVLGFWCCDNPWLGEYTKKLKLKPTDVKGVQKKYPDAQHLALCWPDSSCDFVHERRIGAACNY